ncbi:hypothetical protein WJX73_010544 [Symbiochloris irregularis]|uniref:Transmembrane protein 230 n=1 Tax=Symbiochloris irregularis TaxID=706552 RepID=A0AAW1NRH5_9CHLO
MEAERLTPGSLSAPTERRGERPSKAVWLALALFSAGLLLILIGVILHFTDPEAYGIALFCLGGVIFIPGAYYSFIAFRAWRGHRGYSYNDIPDY